MSMEETQEILPNFRWRLNTICVKIHTERKIKKLIEAKRTALETLKTSPTKNI